MDAQVDFELLIPCCAMNAALNLSPLIVPEMWGGKSTLNVLLFPKNGANRDELRGSLEELPCVQSWEEGFLQGVGELFPSALSSLLMSCPLQGAER